MLIHLTHCRFSERRVVNIPGTRDGEDGTGPLERFDDVFTKAIECLFEDRELCFDLIKTRVLLDVHKFVKVPVEQQCGAWRLDLGVWWWCRHGCLLS